MKTQPKGYISVAPNNSSSSREIFSHTHVSVRQVVKFQLTKLDIEGMEVASVCFPLLVSSQLKGVLDTSS